MCCGKPNLSFSTGPKLPDGPFKRSEPSKTYQTGCGKPSLSFSTGPKLPDGRLKRSEPPKPLAKSFLFYWPETAGWSLQTLRTTQPVETCQTGFWSCQTGSWRCQTMAVASQIFPFLLARSCRMVPSNAPNPPNPSKLPKPALGAATPALGAGKLYGLWQAKSFLSTGPKLPDGKPFKTYQTGSWS